MKYIQNHQEVEISIFEILHIVLRYRYLIMKIVFAGLLAGLLYSVSFYTKLYRSEGVILLDKPVFSDSMHIWYSDQSLRNIISHSFDTVIKSNETLKSILLMDVAYVENGAPVKKSLKNFIGADEIQDDVLILREAISLNFDKQTSLLKIAVTTRNPDVSAFIVNALIGQLIAFYNKELTNTSQSEGAKIKRNKETARKELETAKEKLLKFYQTNKLLTDGDFKKTNEIPPKLKYLEEKLIMEVDEKKTLYQNLVSRSEAVKLRDNSDMSLVSVMIRPEPSISPIPRNLTGKTVIGGLLGLLAAGIYIFLIEVIKIYKEKNVIPDSLGIPSREIK